MLALLLACALGGADAATTRVSDYAMPGAEAWQEPGLRLALRFGRQMIRGHGDAPDQDALAAIVEPAYRLSKHIELTLTLRYSPIPNGPYPGIRWDTGVGATLYPLHWLFVGAGIAYAGMQVSGFPDCDAHGIAGIGRLGAAWAVGELFATGPVLDVSLRRQVCRDFQTDIDNRDRTETFLWTQHDIGITWMLAWR